MMRHLLKFCLMLFMMILITSTVLAEESNEFFLQYRNEIIDVFYNEEGRPDTTKETIKVVTELQVIDPPTSDLKKTHKLIVKAYTILYEVEKLGETVILNDSVEALNLLKQSGSLQHEYFSKFIELDNQYGVNDDFQQFMTSYLNNLEIKLNEIDQRIAFLQSEEMKPPVEMQVQSFDRGAELDKMKQLLDERKPFIAKALPYIVTTIFIIALLTTFGLGMYGYKKYGLKGIFLALYDSKRLTKDIFAPVPKLEYKKMLSTKLGSSYTFALDTNMLISTNGEILNELKNEEVLISKKVQDELDKLKNSSDRQVASSARSAFLSIETAFKNGQKIRIINYPMSTYISEKGLNPQIPDDVIVATYVKAVEDNQNKLIFISNDRGARITARNAGLEVLDM